MNKLRVPQTSPRKPTSSSTWKVTSTPSTEIQNALRQPAVTTGTAPPILPRSAAEQYWAARALTAEALLSARKDHDREVKSIAYAGDVKRAKEIAALQAAHDIRQRKMEHLIMFSIFCITSLIGLIIYLLMTHPHPKPTQSKWGLASHFTIPILSPFTSVVEHEASALGARIIVPSILILAGLLYALLKHWWPHWHVS